MVAAFLSAISALFTLTGKLFEWLYARNLENAGKVQQKLDDLSQQVKDAQIAVRAREAARAAAINDPGRVSEPDEFSRD